MRTKALTDIRMGNRDNSNSQKGTLLDRFHEVPRCVADK
jgi:hypothetical protein